MNLKGPLYGKERVWKVEGRDKGAGGKELAPTEEMESWRLCKMDWPSGIGVVTCIRKVDLFCEKTSED